MSEMASPKTNSPDGSWFPVIMSAAVYPGVGQWMQKRRNAGTFYCFVFTVICLMFALALYAYLRETIPILLNAIEGIYEEGQEIPPLKQILKPFGAVLFIYTANVVDVLKGRAQLTARSEIAPSAN